MREGRSPPEVWLRGGRAVQQGALLGTLDTLAEFELRLDVTPRRKAGWTGLLHITAGSPGPDESAPHSEKS